MLFQRDPFRSSGGDAAACAAWNVAGAKGNASTTKAARVTVFSTARTFGERAALATSFAALQKLLPHPDSCREGHFAMVDEAAWSARSVVAPLFLGTRPPVLSLLKALSRSILEHHCGASAVLAPTLMEEAYLNLLVYEHAHRISRVTASAVAASPVVVVPHGGGCVERIRLPLYFIHIHIHANPSRDQLIPAHYLTVTHL